ncbi:MAG: hypothetical protein Q8L81_07355 [Bacteroidota bacterium]|nr:hypothetical protein [Bacteroidota bacterium]
MKNLIIISLISLLFSNCKKEYVCECTNPGGKFKAFSKRTTKEKADQKCKDYYDENYGKILMSETFCEVR